MKLTLDRLNQYVVFNRLPDEFAGWHTMPGLALRTAVR